MLPVARAWNQKDINESNEAKTRTQFYMCVGNALLTLFSFCNPKPVVVSLRQLWPQIPKFDVLYVTLTCFSVHQRCKEDEFLPYTVEGCA